MKNQKQIVGKPSLPPYNKGMGQAADEVHNAENILWGGLLTFNGFVITIFSGFVINNIDYQLFTSLIILISLLDASLIISNFNSRLNWHYRKALLFYTNIPNYDKEKEQIINDGIKNAETIKKRHPWILALLMLEIILILLLMIWSSLPLNIKNILWNNIFNK